MSYTRRRNVVGQNGPRRDELPTFKNLQLTLPRDVHWEIIREVNNNITNDLEQGLFLNQDESFVYNLGDRYKQIYLQDPVEGSDKTLEENYTVWTKTPYMQKFLEENFGEVCRARISVTPSDFASHWHIDTDTSVLCRVQVIIQSDGCRLEFDRRNVREDCDFISGETYFINVGWKHRLVNPSVEIPKLSVIFGIKYAQLDKFFSE